MIEDLWYKNTVVYNLDVDAFMDGNDDGIGDFEGLVRRLDYLDALGVGTLWLAPFQPSPERDNGYDVSDFYGVDPRYGSSGDFVEFMHQASKRGIKVILDLVVNHTSDQHPWFRQACADPSSRFRDWYIWSKRRPPGWKEGMVFPGYQESTWTYEKRSRQYYFHRFYEFQPDLNTANPEVQAEIRRIMGYWLQLGVSGFRVDAVPFVLEMPEHGPAKVGQDFGLLSDMRRFLQWRAGDAILLGEANVLPKETRRYFGREGGGLQMMFNFWVNQHLFYALATGEVAPLVEALRATRSLPLGTNQWAQFLRGHDELDLGRLTEEQRQRVFDRFAPDPDMQLYDRGIRRRLASMLGDRRHVELAYSLVFGLPGTPVLRYGEEIGMGEDLSLPQREPVRTVMQWSNERHAGFTAAEKPRRPLIRDGIYGYQRVNVESQQRDPGSLLNWMARMIRLRKECPEIGWGDWTVLATGSPYVLALRYDWRGNSVVVVHNFADHPQMVRLRPGVERGHLLVDLIREEESRAGASGVHRLALDAYGYRWFRVGGLNYALRRDRR